ncbi:MAG: response regulator [Rhodocyclaceae bacterium]|nr:response regulator [Rhodocyclaceae bacterium]
MTISQRLDRLARDLAWLATQDRWSHQHDDLQYQLASLATEPDLLLPAQLRCAVIGQALHAARAAQCLDADERRFLVAGLRCLLRDAGLDLAEGSPPPQPPAPAPASASASQPSSTESQLLRALDQHAIVSVGDARGDILHVNDRFVEISGYSREELAGRNHRIVRSGQHPPEFYKSLWDTISSGRVWFGEICNRRKDGTHYWVAATIVPFLGDGVTPTRYVSIRTDITAVKALEREAKEASSAKTDFLSRMSHELRTPMNAILGFVQLLEIDPSLGEEQLDSVGEISRAGTHLLSLLDDILDLARIESGRIPLSIEPVSVTSLLAECRDLMAPVADRRGVRIHLPDPSPALVLADRVRLKQALLNLVSNAIKYNREGGRVDICCVPDSAHMLRISVTDTGLGIPETKHAQLFEPFNRLGAEQSEVEGTGIGLCIVSSLCEMMGGQVGVESTEGEGSTFWISLPTAEPVDSQAPAPAQVASAAAGGGSVDGRRRSILYIEDNPINLRLVARVFEMRDHIELISAHEPLLGLELAQVHRPDLILLDINLPGMDGYEVLERLRADPELAATPVVALTASAMPGDIERGKQAGFNDYLTKPINVGDLLALADSLK